MSSTTFEAARALPTLSLARPRRRAWRGGLQGSEFTWAIAFVIPYAAVFVAFVAYPVFYGLWMGRSPSLYSELASDPIYLRTVVNTTIYLGIGVNLKMFGALLLSGFFMRRSWWTKGLLLIYVLPWAVPALPTFISIHWMLNGQWGLVNNTLWDLFHIDGPGWVETSRWLALSSVIASHIWKWMPFWTVILLAGRMSIPAGTLRRSRGRRRYRPQALHLRHLPAPRQPLSHLHATLNDLHLGRLQLGLFRVGRRTSAFDACAGDAWNPRCVPDFPA